MDERMDAPNGKRIVELLRKAAMGIYEGAKGKVMDNIAQLIGCYGAMDYRTIDKLADMVEEAIQHEHESAYDEGYDAGFASADDWLAEHEDAMAEHGWYRVVDADKQTIRFNDDVEWELLSSGKAAHGYVVGIEIDLIAGRQSCRVKVVRDSDFQTIDLMAKNLHHVKLAEPEPTVEDVLREFADAMSETHPMDVPARITEYAAKLRLAGSDAE